MKAIVYTKYGSPDVLELKDVEKPTPKDNEVLIKVHAASINSWDWDMLTGRPFEYRLISGILKPKKTKILGCDIARRIEAVGRNIMHKPNKNLDILSKLFESGQIKPVVDRCFPLSETAKAFEYFGEGHFKGKVVITVEHNGNRY